MRTFALLATALFFSFQTAQAQSTTNAAATVQTPQKDEVRALSGQLKESLGTMQQLSLSNNKQLQVATVAEVDRLGAMRTEIAGMLTRLEQSLTSVNSANTDTFPAAKAEALTAMEQANELTAKVKGAAPSSK